MKAVDLTDAENDLNELRNLEKQLSESAAGCSLLCRQLLSVWKGRAAEGLETYLRKREAAEAEETAELGSLLETADTAIRERRELEQRWAGRFRETAGQSTQAEAAQTAVLSGASGAETARCSVSAAEKDYVIRRFEAENRELGQKLGSFFYRGGFAENGIYAEEIRSIKYLAYSAPEPYRTVFLKNLDALNLSRAEEDSGQYYSGFLINGVYVDLEHAAADPRGPYTSFFHETAHGINDVTALFGNTTDHYREDGFSLCDRITEDFRERVERELLAEAAENGGLSLNREQQKRISESFLAAAKEQPALTPLEQKIRNRTAQRIALQLGGEREECASDIYGGLTGNLLRGITEAEDGSMQSGYGHEPSYFYRTERTFTGGTRLTDRGKLEEEFFAEYFSYQMTGDRSAAASVADRETGWLPAAAAMVDRMTEQLAENG